MNLGNGIPQPWQRIFGRQAYLIRQVLLDRSEGEIERLPRQGSHRLLRQPCGEWIDRNDASGRYPAAGSRANTLPLRAGERKWPVPRFQRAADRDLVADVEHVGQVLVEPGDSHPPGDIGELDRHPRRSGSAMQLDVGYTPA